MPERLARFTSEQRMLAQLEHPAIARLYDAGTADGTPYFVMEYVDGTPLTDHCRARAASIEVRLQLFRALCEAVQFAHQHAVIHRDIKPSNVLVKPDDDAGLRGAGAVPGRAGRRYTDIYALGVVLYELLAGQLPFDRARSILSVDDCPVPPSIAARRAGRGGAARRAAWAELDLVVLTAISQMGDAMDYPAAIALMRAESALVRGDRDTARAQLQAASVFARPDAIAFQRRAYDRLRARVDRREGAAARLGP